MNEKIINVLQRIERQEKLLENNEFISPDSEDYIYLSKVRNLGLWSVPRSTGEYLNFMVKLIKPKNILELGTSVGYSTIWLGEAAQNLGAHIYATERFIPKIKLAQENFIESGLNETITLIEGNIDDTIKSWDKGEIDFIFMDADKKSYLDYYKLLLPLLSKKGIFIADNINDMRSHLTEFLEYIKNDNLVNSIELNLDNGLLLINKKST